MTFNKWLDTFLSEKNIDLEDSFELNSEDGSFNLFTYQVIVDFMKVTSKQEQKAIKDMLVMIDFKNGDVKHYLRHLAKALV